MERLVEEVSFDAPDRDGQTLTVDAAYVDQRLASLVQDED
jgi:ATP-dependent HslUV protease ATP-binding subunit HslU